jgi:beta-1,4-galactosyltransferase 1/beta-1,4-galactosyltransferase 2
VAVDKFKYQLPYKGIFGGATVVRADQFRKLNGYSNMFWGWGGEDDDMSKRINHHRLKIIRYQADIGRYTMIKHKQEKANKLRQSLLSKTDKR